MRPDIVSALRVAAEDLTSLGVAVSQVDTTILAGAEELYTKIRATEGFGTLRRHVTGRESELSRPMAEAVATEDHGRLPVYLEAMALRESMRARVLILMEELPVLLRPVSVRPAFELRPPTSHWDHNGPLLATARTESGDQSPRPPVRVRTRGLVCRRHAHLQSKSLGGRFVT